MVDEQDKKEEQALNRAVDLIDYTLNKMTPRFTERQFYSNMYHSYDEILKQKQWWQTKFAHSFPFFTTEMKSSFYYEGVFGSNSQGIWQIHPWDENSVRSAELNTKLFRAQEQQSNFVKTFYTGSKGLSIYGDWFLEVFWDRKERFIQQRATPQLDFDGVIQRPIIRRQQGERKIIVDKNQPEASTLYINSVWTDPVASSLESARYTCVRREIPFDELKKLEFEQGRYINIDKLKGTNMPKMPATYYDIEPYNPYVKSHNANNLRQTSPMDKENPLVEVIDIFYPDGQVESIGNRKVFLGKVILYDNLASPLVHIKNFEEIGKFNGMSDYKASAAHWKLINQYQSLEADNILMHHRGYTKIQRDAGPNVSEAFANLGPGSLIEMNNIGGVSHDRPDLFSPQVLTAKQALVNEAQQPMGMNEILGGATPSSNVRSSEQFGQLANFGSKIMSQGIRNISQGLKELGEKWLLLNYEFLDLDATIPVLGQSGVEMIKLESGDLPPTANVSVRLSADLEAQKAQKLQQMLQAINLAQQVPGFNTPDLIRQWFRTQGVIDNVDKMFLLPDEEIQGLILQQFQAQGETGNGVTQEPAAAGATAPPAANQVTSGNNQAGAANIPQL
jgi:hypothetical protein